MLVFAYERSDKTIQERGYIVKKDKGLHKTGKPYR